MASRRHTQTPKDLFDAFVNNNCHLVKSHIENGGDPNVNLASLLPAASDDKVVMAAPGATNDKCAVQVTALSASKLEGILSRLHLAI